MFIKASLFAVILLALAFVHMLWRYRDGLVRATEATWRLAGAVSRSVSGSGGERSAAELLALIRGLSAQGGTWPEILAAVNQTGDPLVGQKLNQLRGPHQFAPHVALNVLADGCERALESNPWAGQREAIGAALHGTTMVVGVGD